MLAVEKYLFSNATKEGVPNLAAKADKQDKNFEVKRRIVACLVQSRVCAIADVANTLDISIPTVTKLIGELIDEGAVSDLGKVETSGGRRPNMFGVVSESLCLLGAEVKKSSIDMIVTDLHGNILQAKTIATPAAKAPEAIKEFVAKFKAQTQNSKYRRAEILRFAQDDAASQRRIASPQAARNDETPNPTPNSSFLTPNLVAVGIAVPCRVNPKTGRTFGMFDEDDTPFQTRMRELLQIPVAIETTARAACAAERHTALHVAKTPQDVADNMLYVTLDSTIAATAVIKGQPYSGHSGLAPDIIGGALLEETASNSPANANRTGNSSPDIDKLIAAARRDDPTAVAQIESAAERAGREIAALAQAFNPELVVVGGALATANDYLMLPLQAAVHRHMAKILYRETRFRTAHVIEHAAALGSILTINH